MSLEVVGISVHLGETDVLADVSLEVADHEVVSVLGPSGSGKTSLLRVIAGLQSPDTGRVLVDGRDVTGVPTHKRGIGLMFQDHALFPHRDVASNVGFGLRMAHQPRAAISERVDEVLDLVGLTGFGGRSIEHLSGGERQRVALARALAPRPAVLLLDEPLGSLDRALRDRLLDDLADVLRASGATVVHVTHDQGEAFATGERVVVIRDGRIVQIGAPEELWRRPVDAGVARIVGPAALVPVEVSGTRVVAPWGDVDVALAPGVADGQAVLVLRPDDVEIADLTAGDPGLVLRGSIVSRAFRGDHVLLRVAVPAGAASSGEGPEGGTTVEIPVIARGPSSTDGAEVALTLVPGGGIVVAPS